MADKLYPMNIVAPKNQVVVESVSVTYIQQADSNSPSSADDHQRLVIATENSGAGFYLVLSTERWAIEKPEEMTNLLNDFNKRINSI